MKKITIGRGRECDIILDDSTDTVSRRQAVITFSPFGKMMIYDTSSNGTFVNGTKVEKPDGMLVKRGDNVNFAHIADLDWDKVKNPYRGIMVSLIVMFLAAVIAAVLYIAFADRLISSTDKKPDKQETVAPTENNRPAEADSLTLKVPVETPTPGPVRNNTVKKTSGSDKFNTGEAAKEVSQKKEINETSDTKEKAAAQKLEDALDQR